MRFLTALLAVTVLAMPAAFAKDTNRTGSKGAARAVASDEKEKSVSKADCLKKGGKANDGSGDKLLCQGGEYNGYTIVDCAYRLDGEAYIGKDDGDLTFKATKYRCQTHKIGFSEMNLCKLLTNKSKHFDLFVGFDGAESDFFVYDEMESEPLCHGVATSKKDSAGGAR